MDKDLVKTDLKQSTHNLLDVLSSTPEKSFNTKSNQEGWSVGEVGDHLIKVETGTVRLFTGSAETSEREPKEKILTIKDRMMDFENKMKANDPIIPDDEPKDKTVVLEKLQDIRQQLAGFVEIHDLTEMIADFDHPIFGSLTRIEWIYFNIYHAKRHTRQIERIQWELRL